MRHLIFPVLVGFLTVSAAVAQIEPNKCENYSSKVATCNQRGNLSTPLRYFSDIFFTVVDGRNCGSLKSDLKLVAGCILDVTRNCSSGEFSRLFTTKTNLSSGIDYSCRNREEISTDCLPNPNVSICARRKQTEVGINTTAPTGDNFEESKTYYCSLIRFTVECFEQLPTATKCQKSNIHLIAIMKYLKPETCGAMTTSATFVLVSMSLLFSLYQYVK